MLGGVHDSINRLIIYSNALSQDVRRLQARIVALETAERKAPLPDAADNSEVVEDKIQRLSKTMETALAHRMEALVDDKINSATQRASKLLEMTLSHKLEAQVVKALKDRQQNDQAIPDPPAPPLPSRAEEAECDLPQVDDEIILIPNASDEQVAAPTVLDPAPARRTGKKKKNA